MPSTTQCCRLTTGAVLKVLHLALLLVGLGLGGYGAYNFVEVHEAVSPFPITMMSIGGILAVVSLLAVVCTNRCCLCIVDVFTCALLLIEMVITVAMLIPPSRDFLVGEVPDQTRHLLDGRVPTIVGLSFAFAIVALQFATLIVSCCYASAAKKEAYDNLDAEEDRAERLSRIGSGGRPQGWQAAIYDRDTASAERRREPLLRGP